MLKARVEISASLQWGVSESDGWFDLVDGDGREWGAIHVCQSLQDGKPFIEYAARVTPPFGTMEATGGIDDLATAMLWIYNRIGVELHVNKAGEIEPLREPVSSYVALAYFSGAAEPVSETFSSMESAAAWVEKKLFVSESTPIAHPYQKPAPDFHD